MTKTEIIAELRRSAVEDADPWIAVDDPTYYAAANMLTLQDRPVRWRGATRDAVSAFFLLCAHALESA